MNLIRKRILALALALMATVILISGCSTKAPPPAPPPPSGTGTPSTQPPVKPEGKPQLLRFGHTLTEQDLFHLAYLEWADNVAGKTDKMLEIEVYANAQLGKEEDVLEQMRQGSNVGWQTDAARLGNYVKELAVLNAPYFVEDLEEVKKLLQSKTISSWNEKLENEFNIKNISFAYVQGYRHVYANKVAKNPTEFKGISIRTAPAPIWVESVRALGVEPVSLPYGELYTGIQTKVVDGCELPYAAAKNLKVFEVAKNIIETKHIYQMNIMVSSSQWFRALPEEYQSILVEECSKAGLKVSQTLEDNAEADKQILIEAGMKYISSEELDMDAFKKASQQAYDKLNLNEAREAVYTEIGKKIVK